MKKVKYTLSLPIIVSERLDSLAKSEQSSKPEIFRRAIGLYSYTKRELESGLKLCFVDSDGKIVKEVVFD